jgi:hypothetical protein
VTTRPAPAGDPGNPAALVPAPSLKRRGLMAAVAGLAAGTLAKVTATPVLAGTDGDVVLNTTNTASAPTTIKSFAGSFPGQAIFTGDATGDTSGFTFGLQGIGSGIGGGLLAQGGQIGGLGVLAYAGSGSFAGWGGEFVGGNSTAGGNPGGTGLVAFAGGGGPTSGAGGVGTHSFGGIGGAPNGAGGAGVIGGGGDGAGTGVDGVGVRGNSGSSATRPGSIGVLGVSDANSANVAVPPGKASVYGLASGIPAVRGDSGGGPGVYGTSVTNAGVNGLSQNTFGVYGLGNNAAGVRGDSGGGPGVQGVSQSNAGVYGQSVNSNGIYGISTNGNAGFFQGNVVIQGNLTVAGSFPKSAAVPHRHDGQLRRLYCMESPESYFEDFGRSQLTNGRATVQLDRDFAAVVHADDYDVFPVPTGDCKGLYVTNKTPTSFEVRELQGGTSSVGFSYRVVAKRLDIPAPRLERVERPTPHMPSLPAPARPDHPEPAELRVVPGAAHRPERPTPPGLRDKLGR